VHQLTREGDFSARSLEGLLEKDCRKDIGDDKQGIELLP
jgi:hypothetical protein